jgi:hypothetical protein
MKMLVACLLAVASVSAAVAQTQNYPASPYLSGRQTAPQQQSPYYGTRSQTQARGYLNPNPYDPNSVYGAGAPSRRLRNPSRTGGIKR